ncbi:phosphotransferase enzyme family protein [Profundibacterium mesophilum]|uniref:Serinethreonine protein kinase n=1 Tax=Profundibacterium mesophilum KAUST100406-0324 TaxID=1037889 RepID=A0A921TDA4_9RHOB|nr:phosphotransferase [Profundibacterium mesophilum]KAF0675942.1 Serinethreonine protein kinase [Profundibacterium mesophilum KAUST100406-0324]
MSAGLALTALRAAAHWTQAPAPPRLIAHRENAVFLLALGDGRRGALRLHRGGYQGDAHIRSELAWTEAIAGAGFPCPAPIRSLSNALLECLPCGTRASVTGWIDAAPFAPAAPPDFHALGARIAALHRASDAIALPEGFERPAWSAEGLLGEEPLWGRFWENPALDPGEAALLGALRPELRHALRGMDADWGLIHGDLLSGNLLHGERGPVIIDFDDGGWGWRLYDLGTALIESVGAADFSERRDAIAEGYGLGDARRLSLFVLLRALASAGWVMSRTRRGDPRQRAYALRALVCARAYAGSNSPA